MLGYLFSLTYSVIIHLLSLSLHQLSLTHSLSFSILLLILFFILCFTFSLSHTLMLSFVTITANCHPLFYKIQVLAIEGDRVQHDFKKNCSDSLTNCSEGQSLYFLQTLNTGNVTQSSVQLSLAWILLHINCHWFLSPLHLFIS